jgi:hypothetical protein
VPYPTVYPDELYGLPVGTETPRGISQLVSKLSTILPGVRLQEKLAVANPVTHQHIADTLASNGQRLQSV